MNGARPGAVAGPSGGGDRREKLYPLVQDLIDPSRREAALLELSKHRELYPDLAPILWHSFGVIAALLQEIVSIYPLLSPPKLSAPQSNRMCNALALLQCVASHNETRQLFLKGPCPSSPPAAHHRAALTLPCCLSPLPGTRPATAAQIPLYLYPFLNTVSTEKPFEYLRLTSLGVIGALVKVCSSARGLPLATPQTLTRAAPPQMDDSAVIRFLLQTEIIPLCLRIMETGSELSRTVATFIVQKILLDDMGLTYICQTPERFFAVSTVLSKMVASLAERNSSRLLKHIVRCYLRLTENARCVAVPPTPPRSSDPGRGPWCCCAPQCPGGVAELPAERAA